MKLTTSYKVQIMGRLNQDGKPLALPKKAFRTTRKICSEVLGFYISVAEQEYDGWKDLKSNECTNFFERLTHHTAQNPNPKYNDFDSRFPKLPSGIRRSAIHEATGIFQAWKSSHDEWLKSGAKKGEPKLSKKHFWNPTLYRCKESSDGGEIEFVNDTACFAMKIFIDNDWQWVMLSLREKDLRSIEKKCWNRVMQNPSFVKKGNRYFITFVFEENVELSDANFEETIVCAVDLGITTDAVCSIIDFSGTVQARKFIDASYEKDQRNHICNRIRGNQRIKRSVRKLWAFADNFNKAASIKTARQIVDFARKHNADVIVFENLDGKGKKPYGIGQKATLWRHKDIVKRCTDMAHSHGMRISTVCPIKTSRLAYDGSGEVKRGWEISQGTAYDICVFQTGKTYNCDLSASYNIGARYFVRLFRQKHPSAVLPKASEVTLSTLWNINALSA